MAAAREHLVDDRALSLALDAHLVADDGEVGLAAALLEATAQASESRCFCPPESLPTRLVRFPSSSTMRSRSSIVRPRA